GAFDQAVAAIDGDRRARQELRKPQPDVAVVNRGLLAGGVHPADVEGLATLFVRLSGFEPMEYILGQWNRSDLLIDELKRIGRRLREAGSALDPAEGAQLLRQIHRVNTTLVPLEDDLAQTLAEIQRTAQSFLIGGILIIS